MSLEYIMARRKTVVTVTLDCAALAWATRHIQTEQDWAKWGQTFVEALATNRAGINDFADDLIESVHSHREQKAEEMRNFREKKHLVRDVTEQSNVTEHSTTSSLVLSSLDKECFEEVRQKYPGTKRGAEPEWENFKKKYQKGAKEIIPLLLPALAKFCRHHAERKTEKNYIPHFKTWINNQGWTAEFPEWDTKKQQEVAQAGMTEEERLREWRRKNVI